MTMNIRIGVDARPVDEAQKRLKALQTTLGDLAKSDEPLLGSKLGANGEAIRELSQNITRLKGLINTGESKGGLLSAKQWNEVGVVSDRIGKNVAKWTSELDKARTALGKVLQEKLKLERVPVTNPQAWAGAQDRLGVLKTEEDRLRKEYDALRKYDPRVQRLGERGAEYAARAGQFGEDAGGASGSGLLKKGVMAGMALAGFGGVLSMLHRSMETFKQTAITESQVYMRGGGGGRRIAWGYGPMDVAQYELEMAQQTGWRGGSLGRGTNTALAFSRATGMASADSVVGFMGDYYRRTGANSDQQVKVLNKMYEMQKRTGAPVEAILSDTRRVIAAVQGTVGAVQVGNTGTAMAMLTGLYGQKGVGLMAPGLLDKVHHGLSSPGDIGSQTMSWAAVGGFNGPMSLKRFRELTGKVQAGIKDNDYLRGMRDLIHRISGGNTESRRMLWESRLGLTVEEANAFDEFMHGGNFDKAQREGLSFDAGAAKYGSGAMQAAAKKAMATAGGMQATTDAIKQSREITTGELIKPSIDKFSNAVNDFINKAINGGLAELPKALKDFTQQAGWLGNTVLYGGAALGARKLLKGSAAGSARGAAAGEVAETVSALSSQVPALAALTVLVAGYLGVKNLMQDGAKNNAIGPKYLGKSRSDWSEAELVEEINRQTVLSPNSKELPALRQKLEDKQRSRWTSPSNTKRIKPLASTEGVESKGAEQGWSVTGYDRMATAIERLIETLENSNRPQVVFNKTVLAESAG